MKFNKGRPTAIYLALFILAADFFSKFLVASYIPMMDQDSLWYPYGGIGIFKKFLGIEFSIVHVTNKGAAWSTFEAHQDILLYVRILLIAALLIYAFFYNKNRSLDIPLALVISGAIGNVMDYFIYGHVVDMLYFVLWGYSYPVFNIADSAVTIGVLWLAIAGSWNSKNVKTALNNK